MRDGNEETYNRKAESPVYKFSKDLGVRGDNSATEADQAWLRENFNELFYDGQLFDTKVHSSTYNGMTYKAYSQPVLKSISQNATT